MPRPQSIVAHIASIATTLLQEILASCLFSDFETRIFSDTLF